MKRFGIEAVIYNRKSRVGERSTRTVRRVIEAVDPVDARRYVISQTQRCGGCVEKFLQVEEVT
jgi:hypothetical protein